MLEDLPSVQGPGIYFQHPRNTGKKGKKNGHLSTLLLTIHELHIDVTSSYDGRNCDCDGEGDGAGTMVKRKVKFGMLPSVSLLDR